ncbi:glycogen synthase GlgA [bacterium]|nr:glycogen synthase GlgA [candidate division CSSED10-310 bacterium]
MHVLFAASEATPLARTSCMGDVVAALPRALQNAGIETSLVIPRYKTIPDAFPLERIARNIPIPIGDGHKTVDVYLTQLDRVHVYLIDQPDYYCRDGLYRFENEDYLDNAERFIFFSRAVVELIPFYGSVPSIVHCHDWQTGLIPLYLKRYTADKAQYHGIRSLFTIHNLVSQGLFWRFDMHLTGLPWEYFRPDGIEFYGDLNLLKAGLLYSDAINTVSPTYCREIQTPEFGCGLDGVLRSMETKLCGILNGADYDYWSPLSGEGIPAAYTHEDPTGKKICKEALMRQAGLDLTDDAPLLCIISPLYGRKGVDLLELSIPDLVDSGCRIILQGIGDRNYVHSFEQLAAGLQGSFRFYHNLDPIRSREIIAGSDILIKPSRFEPCGLNQIYALRFGTIPVVHQTGGLDDTVIDDPVNSEIQTGFKFKDYSREAMQETIHRALAVFRDPDRWLHLIRNAMRQDFSWNQSADRYLMLYRKLLGI